MQSVIKERSGFKNVYCVNLPWLYRLPNVKTDCTKLASRQYSERKKLFQQKKNESLLLPSQVYPTSVKNFDFSPFVCEVCNSQERLYAVSSLIFWMSNRCEFWGEKFPSLLERKIADLDLGFGDKSKITCLNRPSAVELSVLVSLYLKFWYTKLKWILS